jgi:hypothetical protein
MSMLQTPISVVVEEVVEVVRLVVDVVSVVTEVVDVVVVVFVELHSGVVVLLVVVV